ncbi:AMP deaminase [Hamiltosporidium tvaerminnensis]|uniref:AMP deaminase n=1 Tax=Hamiltosporidium tvaerminnensis TaxID=1176355 RepID=A0A4Q9LTJ1_9MICR|nr:AMP deaminase [Hamiltosporidium tvaerminnensis]
MEQIFSWRNFESKEDNHIIYSKLAHCMKTRKFYQEMGLQSYGYDEYGNINIGQYVNNKYEGFVYTKDGLFALLKDDEEVIFSPTIEKFYTDCDFLINLMYYRPAKSLCFRRLENLKHSFVMYQNLAAEKEKKEQKLSSKRDFYKVIKVDTHVHHSASMNSKHLLKFIKNKLLTSPCDDVYQKDDKIYTLSEIFKELNISLENLCIDTLDTHAHTETFHRFDRFNFKYNPYGQPILREIFLKYDNYIRGKYLSELTKEVFNLLDDSKYHYMEYRLSIYGKSKLEWDILASWIIDNNLDNEHVRWIIQIPRLFMIFKGSNLVNSFGDMLQNIFEPVFEITQFPERNPKLAKFLEKVVGFDSVDDESLKERRYHRKFPLPDLWCHKENPPYSYYIYFLYANISSLNHFRLSKNKNIFSFRPHSGECGEVEHLVYTFFTAQSISHGVQLRKSLILQYLYYLAQIGLAMSPLSNNSLFISIENNPFPDFFKKGLLVSLSTDDPLQFHFTKEPLMEEYSVACQIWKMSSTDQCELSRNSVLQSNYEHELKKDWIGDKYYLKEVESNDFSKTNVPDMRIYYRYKILQEELKHMNLYP